MTPNTDPPLTAAQLWSKEIIAAETELKKFHERARSVTKKFLDERDSGAAASKWFNIFYANSNILESALYAQLPKPSVSRRFTDYNDDIGRTAALIIERAITQDLDSPEDTFDATLRHCVQDRLVPGLSQAWLRLETETETLEVSVPPTPGNDADEVTEPTAAAEPAAPPQKITSQKVCVDYIFWEDFLWSPCRVWQERRWVGRKAYMSRKQLVKRFKEKGELCPLDYAPGSTKGANQGSTPKEDTLSKAVVYEIWCRETKKVYWYNKGLDFLLDERDDPLKLVGFEPCPMPMLANTSTSNTTPRPDYYMLQDQYGELDTINNRISMLVRACKVVGVYDKSAAGIQAMLTEGTDNKLIPVDNWAMFAEKGGIKGTIDWLPLEAITQALQQLNQAREVIKGQIYELTGIADIVRGASKASETLGAQQIKAQFASVRIKKLQDEVARFASEIMRIKAEIMVKHFDPEILYVKSNIAVTGNDQWVAPAMQLLQDEAGFEWRIQITADTMSQADYAMEKKDRIEFLTAISKFIAEMGPIITSNPESAPLLLGILKWTIAAFRGAREIEGMLDKALDALQKTPAKSKEPSPDEQRAKGEQERMQMQMQIDQQKAAADQQAAQQKQMFEQQRMQMELAAEKQRMSMEAALEQQRLQAEQARQQTELMFTELMGKLKLKNLEEVNDAKLEAARAQAQAKADTDAGSGDKD